jgi:hypothetical protein
MHANENSIVIFRTTFFKTIMLALTVFTSYHCKADDPVFLCDHDFSFTIDFYPSFIENCRVILQKKGDIDSLTVINSSMDENVRVKKAVFSQFKDDLSEIDLSKQRSLVPEGIIADGITVNFNFKSDSINHSFSFRCPRKSDTSEFQIIKSIFAIMESSFRTQSAINYIERLKGYFDLGLPVKHISDKPLEYRFYGHLSRNEAQEFRELMSGLPRNKLIIFDFSNFEGMGRMFYNDFQLLVSQTPKVYWLVNESSKKQVLEMGVKPDRIFNDRQKLISEMGRN